MIRNVRHFPCFALLLLFPATASARTARPAASACLRLLHQGEPARAEACARAQLRRPASTVSDELVLARALMRQNRLLAAWQQLRRAHTRHPRNVDVDYFLAQVTGALARQEFESMYRLNPSFWRVHELAGDAARAQGDTATAEREYRQAEASAPRGQTVVLDALGDLAGSQRRFDQARHDYAEALRRRPDDAGANYGMGAILLSEGKPAAAMAPLLRALRSGGDDPEVLLNLGQACMETRQPARAVSYLRRAARAGAGMRAWNLLGRAWQSMGQAAKARAAFAEASRLSRQQMRREQNTLHQMNTQRTSPQERPR